jgi:hypothetical protein
MNTNVRIARNLLTRVRADLSRPHAFAVERVGFLYGCLADTATTPLVLLTDYEPVADHNYINDPCSGARIDSTAIRTAMQGVLDRGHGGFHVHMHNWPGRPILSPMDAKEIPPVVTGLRRVGIKQAHGIILLHDMECAAWVWHPDNNAADEAESFSVVGFPYQTFWRDYS